MILNLGTEHSLLSFDGASLHVARAQQALKARVCVEWSRGMFP